MMPFEVSRKAGGGAYVFRGSSQDILIFLMQPRTLRQMEPLWCDARHKCGVQ